MQKITKCPYCGSDLGMFAKFKANGTDIYSLMEKWKAVKSWITLVITKQ